MSTPEFALIGHQESWCQITRIVSHLRAPDKPRLDEATIREIVPWIPPRSIFRLEVGSPKTTRPARGIYVESFLTPDELVGGAGTLRRAVAKVEASLDAAARAGARVATLGGFTSILVEGNPGRGQRQGLAVTTGNSLTAAFIIQSIARAAVLPGAIRLCDARLLLIGATGDVGSACARYLAPRVRQVQLVARRPDRLAALVNELRHQGIDAVGETDMMRLLPHADYVIAAASLTEPGVMVDACANHAIVCDAGYPKNLRSGSSGSAGARVYWGGLGRVSDGWTTDSDLVDAFYSFPVDFVAHGCMLEGMLLALAGRFESYSTGRGNITPERIDEIWRLAEMHGMSVAPFFDGHGLWGVA